MRPISDNVEDVLNLSLSAGRSLKETFAVALQAYLTECLSVIDRNNPETWPKDPFAPSGQQWACHDPCGFITAETWIPREKNGFDEDWENYTWYFDPTDIMPEGM